MWINTKEFSREADHFLKYGYYTAAPKGTHDWRMYWKEQKRRCVEGHSIGGQRITGDHYAYLNFNQIRKTDDADLREAVKNKSKKKRNVRSKEITFPDFWDGDAFFFSEMEEARNNGQNLAVGKARRKGFSYKLGSIANTRVQFYRNYSVIVGAYDYKFLMEKNRIFDMVVSYINFFNEHTAFAKRRDYVDQKYRKRFSIKAYVGDHTVEKGFKSEISAVSFGHNPAAAIGSDNDLIILEEAGNFPNLEPVISQMEPTTRDGDVITGQIVAFGAGGSHEAGEDFEWLFYNGDIYRFRKYDHVFDEKMSGTSIGFFFPNYWNKIGYMDDQGNSLVDEAYRSDMDDRQKVKKTTDSEKYRDWLAANCHTPEESFIVSSSSIFPTNELKERERRILSNRYERNIGMPGEFYYQEGRPRFKYDSNLVPLNEFPIKDVANKGCVMIYEHPVSGKNGTPDGMYVIGHDPYAHDSGKSAGAAFVYKRYDPSTGTGNTIVASYVARPKTLDDYNFTLFALSDYYNAKIGFENDRGSVISYARRHKRLGQLARQFTILSKQLQGNSRSYGMHMTREHIKDGESYIKDWLLSKRGDTEDGKSLLTIDHLYDLGLIRELYKYKDDGGNYDRIRALIVTMYHMHELTYQKPVLKNNVYNNDPFFQDQTKPVKI